MIAFISYHRTGIASAMLVIMLCTLYGSMLTPIYWDMVASASWGTVVAEIAYILVMFGLLFVVTEDE